MKLFKNILMALVVIATLSTAVAVTTPVRHTPTTCKWCGEKLVSIEDINETTALVSIEDVNRDLVSIEDIHANLIPIQNKY
jgi:hypothetical protein